MNNKGVEEVCVIEKSFKYNWMSSYFQYLRAKES